MLQGKSLSELAQEIERQNEAKRDYLVDTSKLAMEVPYDSDGNHGAPKLIIDDGAIVTGINGIAHQQISDRLQIPKKYYDRMLEEKPQLLVENVNEWLHNEFQRRMIRTMDGTTRAFLSGSYRRIDNYEVAQAVLPIISEMQGARVESCEITDRRMYLKVVCPRIQTEVVPGDVVQSGIVISNSEVGQGAVNIMPMIYRLVCANGMIAADSGQKKYHTGRGNEANENYELYSDATLIADDRAFMLKVQDIVRATVDQTKFENIVKAMRDATGARITSADIPAVVELAAKEYRLTQAEGSGILGHLIRGGDLSLYGLANATTRFAHDVDSYDRSTELEALGWGMVNMPRTTWNRLNAAAAAAA